MFYNILAGLIIVIVLFEYVKNENNYLRLYVSKFSSNAWTDFDDIFHRNVQKKYLHI